MHTGKHAEDANAESPVDPWSAAVRSAPDASAEQPVSERLDRRTVLARAAATVAVAAVAGPLLSRVQAQAQASPSPVAPSRDRNVFNVWPDAAPRPEFDEMLSAVGTTPHRPFSSLIKQDVTVAQGEKLLSVGPVSLEHDAVVTVEGVWVVL